MTTPYTCIDKLRFGIFETYELWKAYSVDPDYIEWCIIKLDWFCISDIDVLQNYNVLKDRSDRSHLAGDAVLNVNFVLLESLGDWDKIPNNKFRFMPETLLLNSEKVLVYQDKLKAKRGKDNGSYASDYDSHEPQDYDDFDSWNCDICGGSSETGCLYFDPTECPNS
jgi:hypothetical protein